MKKLKYKIEYITRKELIDLNHLKQSVFDGNIYIFKKFSNSFKLIDFTNTYFLKHFGIEVEDLIKKKVSKKIQEKKLIDFQKKFKNSKYVLKLFANLLKELKFNINETSSDKITFRYSPIHQKNHWVY